MKYASTFAGIGGFDLGFDQVGMEPTIQVEIDENCQKVLSRHWPNTPKAGDICDVNGRGLGTPDLICGGFPCQDLSIAAPHRKGLAGSRSGLYFEMLELINNPGGLDD